MSQGNHGVEIPRVKLGTQGLEVCPIATLFCNFLSSFSVVLVIKEAFNNGITFFDTSDAYGPYTNETLLGKVLKQLPREKVQVATKFGITFDNFNPKEVKIRGDPAYMGELKKLVEEGKIKHIGLSEASSDTIKRAHAVHPITAVQMEWSIWTRDIEPEIVPLCRKLGIAIVAYSPIGRGFFGGKGITESLPSETVLLCCGCRGCIQGSLKKVKRRTECSTPESRS
ncbi:unnamed protein product [Linum tenue]|uniref:NADP-dependent oxidoreductase domain-containing protein n=1 Tax=Linum tenue TaxID=586396 RepID=A0AAV0LEL7_9ROSI|nr:unnamed protein product [Linum tenue]